MQRLLIISLSALVGAGCASTTQTPSVASDHPAAIDAAVSPMPEPSQALINTEPLATPPSGASSDPKAMQHGGMSGMGNMSGMSGMSGMSHGDATSTSQPATAAAMYVCPMHPEVTSNEPGKCPKCGMKLVKNEQGGHGGH